VTSESGHKGARAQVSALRPASGDRRTLPIRISGAVGLALLVTTRHRWDWIYTSPAVWWRQWQAVGGFILCGIASGLTLWHRVTPYSDPDSTDPDATIVLGLDEATTERAEG
jgi:hypothetical protein